MNTTFDETSFLNQPLSSFGSPLYNEPSFSQAKTESVQAISPMLKKSKAIKKAPKKETKAKKELYEDQSTDVSSQTDSDGELAEVIKAAKSKFHPLATLPNIKGTRGAKLQRLLEENNLNLDQFRKERKKFQNRISALKSRKKKRDYVAGLEEENQGLQDKNDDLSSENDKLVAENLRLKAQIQAMNENLQTGNYGTVSKQTKAPVYERTIDSCAPTAENTPTMTYKSHNFSQELSLEAELNFCDNTDSLINADFTEPTGFSSLLGEGEDFFNM